MACYSYSSGLSVNFNNNIEQVYNVSGNTYSYSNIYWVCEFPVADQLKVYTRAGVGQTETLRILNTDYTINTQAETITFTSTPTGQVVIRRATPSDKMMIRFLDGAKLTATELNACFHQVLFAVQEKELLNATVNNYYSVSTPVSAWASGVSYAIGQIVSYNNQLWQCLQVHTSGGGNAPIIPLGIWQLINTSTSGFLVINNPINPVVFDLQGMAVGQALLWNGQKFVPGNFSSTLDSLTDVVITAASNNQLLRYNGTNWVNISPTIDVTLANIVFQDRPFLGNVTNNSYSSATPLTLPAPAQTVLGEFKNPSNQWVLTDAPTFYHMLQKVLPATADPITYFTNVTNTLNSFANNIGNPVKAKLYWNLGFKKVNRKDANDSTDTLDSYKTAFWGSPSELYNSTNTISLLEYHAVRDVADSNLVYRDNPYYYRKLQTNDATGIEFVSKVFTYGIKAFYLSVPECSTIGVTDSYPMVQESSNSFVTDTYIGSGGTTFTEYQNQLGNETNRQYRDYYLLALRDMAFAAARPLSSSPSNDKDRDSFSRLLKGGLINVEYEGLSDILFRRLEAPLSESSENCWWRIPANIIYWNKHALAHSNKDFAELTTNSSFNKNTVRFTGFNKLHGTVTNSISTLTNTEIGYPFKSNKFWSTWQEQWSTDAVANSNKRFNEADIDWVVYGLTGTNTDPLKLFRTYSNSVVYSQLNETHNNDIGQVANHFVPWPYRPNNMHDGNQDSSFNAIIGTHLFNLDYNKLFSEATNFMPDPVDEYVYRVVLKKGLTPLFRTFNNTTMTTLNSAVILEYGFSDNPNTGSTALIENRQDIFSKQNNSITNTKYRARSRFDYSKVQVYIKKEQIERINNSGTNEDRYVITLGIRTPRIKSIGYSKVFRKFRAASVGADFPKKDVLSADTEIDSGPWMVFEAFRNAEVPLTEPSWHSISSQDSDIYDQLGEISEFAIRSAPNTDKFITGVNYTSGRNECAVKFTRVGIPGNLWIRLSVINTDGTSELLDSSGFVSGVISES